MDDDELIVEWFWECSRLVGEMHEQLIEENEGLSEEEMEEFLDDNCCCILCGSSFENYPDDYYGELGQGWKTCDCTLRDLISFRKGLVLMYEVLNFDKNNGN